MITDAAEFVMYIFCDSYMHACTSLRQLCEKVRGDANQESAERSNISVVPLLELLGAFRLDLRLPVNGNQSVPAHVKPTH